MPAPCLSTPTAPSVSTTPNPSSTWGALPPVSVPSLPTSLLLSRLTSAPFLCTPALPALHELSPHFARKKCLPAFVQEHRWSLKHHMDRPSSKTVKYNHFYPPALRGATHPCSNSQTPHARVGPWRRGSPRLAGSLPPSRSLPPGLCRAPGWPLTHACGTRQPGAHTPQPLSLDPSLRPSPGSLDCILKGGWCRSQG